MRALVQRVTRAGVVVEGTLVGSIDTGLMVLLGVTHTDTAAVAVQMADKIHGLRILHGERSLADEPTAGVLVVSQFTLYGDARKGRRPTWIAAAPAELAEPLVETTVARLVELGTAVATGIFGAHMQVELVNDGPFTVSLEL